MVSFSAAFTFVCMFMLHLFLLKCFECVLLGGYSFFFYAVTSLGFSNLNLLQSALVCVGGTFIMVNNRWDLWSFSVSITTAEIVWSRVGHPLLLFLLRPVPLRA